MNISPETHPTQKELAAFLAGKLNAAESDDLERHLASCPDCCTVLDALPSGDTIVSLLKAAEADTSISPDAARPIEPTILPDAGGETSPPGGTTAFAGGTASGLRRELRDHPRYRIVELIGRGGMGDVYKAEHKVMNRLVAIKVIKPQLVKSDAAVRRFRREAQAAAKLRHPNIVTAFDAEQAGDLHYLVMEYVDGVDLDEVIRRRGPLSVETAGDYIRQAAEGLQHAHELGMVHRDIKPHNLMVTGYRAPPASPSPSLPLTRFQVKILDFGLANFASEAAAEDGEAAVVSEVNVADNAPPRLTQIGTMMGTPDYIAPEQAQDAGAADIRADIYSLGCTFFTLLTGKAPFGEGSVLDKVKAHTEQDAPPLSEFRSDVPAEIEAVLQKMMAKDPAARYQTPAEVAAALERVGSIFSDPRHVSLLPTAPRVGKKAPAPRAPRRFFIAAAVAALFLALALAAAIFYIQTDYGVVRVEVADPSLEVTINGQTITMQDGDKPLTIRPGRQKLIVRRDGSDFDLVTKSFQLRRGDRVALKVELLPGEVVVMKDGERFGEKALPADELNEIRVVFDERDGRNGVLEVDGEEYQQAEEGMLRIAELLAKNPESVVVLDAVPSLSLNRPEDLMVMERVEKLIAATGAEVRLSPALRMAKERAMQRDERTNQLRQIGLALHEYHDAHQFLPPGNSEQHPEWFDENGRPHLSWRVHLLPIFDHEDLYKRFRLNQPWDSPHNKPLLAEMPPQFKTTGDPTTTTLLAVVGEGTAYEGRAGLTLQDIKDGWANTAYVVDAGRERAVPWTKPDDLPFDKEDPIRAFGTSEFSGEFLALMADGSWKSIPYDTSPESLRALFTRAAGDTFDENAKRTTTAPEQTPEELVLVRRLTGRTASSGWSSSIAASADGRWLISADESDNTARLWDVGTGESVFAMPMESTLVMSVAISRDGKWAAVFGMWPDKKAARIDVWNLAERAKVRELDLDDLVESMTFSADGRRLVTCANIPIGTCSVWDLASGEQIHTQNSGYGHINDCVAIPGSSDVVLNVVERPGVERDSVHEGKLSRWNVDSGRITGLAGFPNSGWGVGISSDGSRAVVVAVEQVAQEPVKETYSLEVRELKTGELLKRLETGEFHLRRSRSGSKMPAAVCFFGGDRFIAAGYLGGGIRVWDAQTGRQVAHQEDFGKTDLTYVVTYIVPLADGRLASFTGRVTRDPGRHDIQIWKLPERVWPETKEASAEPIQLAAKLTGHEATIKALRFMPGDRQLLSLAGDKTLRTWDVASHEAKVTQLPLEGSIDDADFSPDGALAVVSVPRIRQAHVWNVAESKEIVKFAPSELYAERIVFSPDGSKLLLSGKPAFGKVYDAKTGHELDEFIIRDEASTGAAFSADGRHVALSVPQEMSLWRTKDHHRTGNSWSTWPSSSCLAMGNELWAAGYIDGKVFMMWVNHDAPPETQVHPGLFEGVGRVTHLEFFDGDRFLLMTWDSGMIRIADLTTGKVVAEVQGPPGCGAEAALSSDRRYLATGGGEVWDEKLGRKSSAGDFQIYLWQLPESVWPEAPPEELMLQRKLGPTEIPALPSALAASANGLWLISAEGSAKSARLWDVAAGEPVFTMPIEGDRAQSVAISRDGKWGAVYATQPKGKSHVDVWNLTERKRGRRLELPYNHHIVMAFSADGRRLVTGGQFGKPDEVTPAIVWDIATGEQVHTHVFSGGFAVDCKAIPGTQDVMLSVAKAGDTNSGLLTGGTLWRWNVESGQLSRPAGFPESGHGFDISSDGTLAAVVAVETTGLDPIRQTYSIEVREFTTGELVQRLETGVNERPAPATVCFLDGDRYVAAGYMVGEDAGGIGAIRVWDVQSGRLAAHRPESGRWMYTSLVPLADGRLAAFGPRDFDKPTENDIEIWQLPESVWPLAPEQLTPIGHLEGHAETVTGIAWHPGGERAVSCAYDGEVRMWEVGSGEVLWTARLASDGTSLGAIALSPGGRFVATADVQNWSQADEGRNELGEIHLLDAETGKEINKWPAGVKGGITALAFSPGGDWLAGVGIYGSPAAVWDVGTGKQISTRDDGQDAHDVAFTADGQTMITSAGRNFSARGIAYDYEGIKGFGGSGGSGYELPAYSVAVKPDGSFAASGHDRGEIVLHRKNGKLFGISHAYRDTGHQGRVAALAFTPDGRHLISGGSPESRVQPDQTYASLFVWRVGEGKVENRVYYAPKLTPVLEERSRTPIFHRIALSPDGRTLLSCGGHPPINSDARIHVWKLPESVWPAAPAAPAIEEIGRYAVHEEAVTALAVSPDGGHVLSAGGDKKARYWNLETRETVHVLEAGEGLRAAEISPQGKLAATGGAAGAMELWDLAKGESAGKLSGAADEILALRFTPDGKRLAAKCADGSVRVWNVESREMVYSLDCGLATRVIDGKIQQFKRPRAETAMEKGLAISPDGKLLAVQNGDETELFDLETGESRSPDAGGPRIHIASPALAFSPDGGRLAIGGTWWSMVVKTDWGHFPVDDDLVSAAAFTPDGRRVILTGGAGEAIGVFEVETSLPVSGTGANRAVASLMALTSDGRHLVTAGGAGAIFVWQLPESVSPAVKDGEADGQ